MTRRLVTAKRLYVLLLATSALGVLIPLWEVLTHRARGSVNKLVWLFFQFLQTLPTQHYTLKFEWYSYRYAVFNACVFAVLLVGYRPIIRHLAKAETWWHDDTHRFPRRTIFLTSLALLVSFQLRIHWGFWMSGICGWTEAGTLTELSATPPPALTLTNSTVPAFLKQAIVEENAVYLPQAGYLTARDESLSRNTMFLHYRSGEILPANADLFDMVFHWFIFRKLETNHTQQRILFDMIRSALGYRVRGRLFLLPTCLAYPNHATYMPISYESYPPPDQLKHISFWAITIHVNSRREVEIVHAERLGIFDAPEAL